MPVRQIGSLWSGVSFQSLCALPEDGAPAAGAKNVCPCVRMCAAWQRTATGLPLMNEDPVNVMAAALPSAEAGDAAAKEALFAALYHELHRLAQAHLRRSHAPLTLSTTTLLHEAYLDIAGRNSLAFPDRHRFLAYASRAMRSLVIDYVRQRCTLRRGGELTFTTMPDEDLAPPDHGADMKRLDTALEDLAALDPALAELVDLKFFCGFSFSEIAAMRNVSERTVQRDWAKARTLLHHWLDEQGSLP